MKQETQEDIDRDNAIIRDGITDEALAALERRIGFNLPVFQRMDNMGVLSDKMFMNRALIKDGQREVIYYIRSVKNK